MTNGFHGPDGAAKDAQANEKKEQGGQQATPANDPPAASQPQLPTKTAEVRAS